MEEDLQREKEHLQKVLGWNGYPKSFISSSTKHHSNNKNQESHTDEIKVFIPYVQGMSEDIRRVCRQHGIKTIFKSAPTLRSRLTKVKYQLPIDKHSGIVYEIPCTCGKVYVGETIRRLGTRIKEHKEACQSCSLDKSAIAEHAWTEHHPIKWDNVKILDNANRQDLLRLKEAIHIQLKDEGDRESEQRHRNSSSLLLDINAETIVIIFVHSSSSAHAHACVCFVYSFKHPNITVT